MEQVCPEAFSINIAVALSECKQNCGVNYSDFQLAATSLQAVKLNMNELICIDFYKFYLNPTWAKEEKRFGHRCNYNAIFKMNFPEKHCEKRMAKSNASDPSNLKVGSLTLLIEIADLLIINVSEIVILLLMLYLTMLR